MNANYALLAYMLRKRLTRFVRKVFARKGLPTGNFRLFRPLVSRKTYFRASKDILPVPYDGWSFSSNVLLVKDFLMLEVLLLKEDLAKEVNAERILAPL